SPGDRIETGQEIRIPPLAAQPERPARKQPRREPPTDDEEQFVREMIIHEDPHGFVLNKPPGLATQGGTKTHHHLDRLLDGLAGNGGRPKLVHRLDKDTSGVLLVARSARAAGHFSKAFSGRTARKVYWALITGVPSAEEGLIDRAGNRAAWVELQPLTGRTHQLRAHMAAIGHPIVGDGKYGGAEAFLTGSISRKMHLHARRLVIDAPKDKDGGGGSLDV